MVYALSQGTQHEMLRQGAVALPAETPGWPGLYAHGLLVWGEAPPTAFLLDNTLREVALTLHNAGGKSARITQVELSGNWLSARWPEQILPPDGHAISVKLGVRPRALPPGRHVARVTVRANFVGGGGQTLHHDVTLEVPAGPLPWFDQAALTFGGPWPARVLRVSAAVPVQVSYGGEPLAPPDPEQALTLYPAEYTIEAPVGTPAQVQVGDGPALPHILPMTWRIPGPVQRVTLRNLGSRPLEGRLVSSVGWLQVWPEWVELAPGQEMHLVVECFDDGRYWPEVVGVVHLRTRFTAQVLATLPVLRAPLLPGPQPILAEQSLRFPAVITGGTSQAVLHLNNGGDLPLRVWSDPLARPTEVPPGATAAVTLAVAQPLTARPGHQTGVVALSTNGFLPYWRFLDVPCTVDVVQATLRTTQIDFGDVRYREAARVQIQVERSDYGRGRLVIDLPTELADVLRLTGDILWLQNRKIRSVVVDHTVNVRADDLGGALLGQIHVRGRCLVPRLEVRIPMVTVVPGRKAVVPMRLIDAGGGLELFRIEADQPWAVVVRQGSAVTVTVQTDRRERGRKETLLTFFSNDYTHPQQQHALIVNLTPTRWMRVEDRVRSFWLWIWLPLHRRLKPYLHWVLSAQWNLRRRRPGRG